jgi:hypothetical protein
METLHHQKQQIADLQAKCATLKQTIDDLIGINSISQSMTRLLIGSWRDKEHETIQQQQEDMEMLNMDQNYLKNEMQQKEAYN